MNEMVESKSKWAERCYSLIFFHFHSFSPSNHFRSFNPFSLARSVSQRVGNNTMEKAKEVPRKSIVKDFGSFQPETTVNGTSLTLSYVVLCHQKERRLRRNLKLKLKTYIYTSVLLWSIFFYKVAQRGSAEQQELALSRMPLAALN